MARIVKVNTFDKLIHVCYGSWVHKGLLCDISDEISDLLRGYEHKETSWSSKPDAKDAPKPVFNLLLQPCELINKKGVEMWTRFLYGQPMWTFRDKDSNKEDFRMLMEVFDWARACCHDFAVDAALDAIRVMLRDHSDDLEDPMTTLAETWAPLLRPIFRSMNFILIDFMVYGKDAEKIKVWAFDTDSMRAGEEETFLLKLEFQRSLNEKALVEQQGLPASDPMEDLMERCRYHRHGKFGTGPCYLEPVGQPS